MIIVDGVIDGAVTYSLTVSFILFKLAFITWQCALTFKKINELRFFHRKFASFENFFRSMNGNIILNFDYNVVKFL